MAKAKKETKEVEVLEGKGFVRVDQKITTLRVTLRTLNSMVKNKENHTDYSIGLVNKAEKIIEEMI
jgi:hypothetical protein